jgi:hypothetical protein
MQISDSHPTDLGHHRDLGSMGSGSQLQSRIEGRWQCPDRVSPKPVWKKLIFILHP